MLSLKNIQNASVLLCFRSIMLKKHRFYYVFAETLWKTNSFIAFSLNQKIKNVSTLKKKRKILVHSAYVDKPLQGNFLQSLVSCLTWKKQIKYFAFFKLMISFGSEHMNYNEVVVRFTLNLTWKMFIWFYGVLYDTKTIFTFFYLIL